MSAIANEKPLPMADEFEGVEARGLSTHAEHGATASEIASQDPGTHGQNEIGEKMNWQTILALFTLMFTYNAYLFTLQMPAAILSFINADIGPQPSYSWISITWNLGACVVVTVSGRLADIFGRRWFFIFGASLSCVGAIIGATAKTIPTMIGSGVLFEIGGGCQEMVFSAFQEIVPYNYRYKLLGINEMSNWFSQLGPLIAYVFVAHTPLKWRTVYWYAFAFEFTALILLIFFYKPPTFSTKHREDHKTKLELLRELDYVGLLLFTAATVLLLLGINFGGGLYHWRSPVVISCIVVGGSLFFVLAAWEIYAPLKYPILPPRLFRRYREFTSVLVVVFVAGMLYYSMIVLWPRESALLFIPANKLIIRGVYANMSSFGVMLGGIYLVAVNPYVGHQNWQLVFLSVVQTVFIGAMASVGLGNKAEAIAFVIVTGAASTPVSPMAFGMLSLALEDQTDIGVAVGVVSTTRLLGGAIATAIYTTILGNRYSSTIPEKVATAASSTGFTGSLPALLKASATNTAAAYNAVAGATPAVVAAVNLAVKQAYVEAYALVFQVAIAFGVLSIIAALSIKPINTYTHSSARAVYLENETKPGVEEKVAV